jgi:hypothetical protein
MADGTRTTTGAMGCLVVALAVSGCGAQTATRGMSQAVERDVAGRFAAAVLRGDAAGARALLVRPDEPALVFLVRRAAAPWKTQHASIHLPARRVDSGWTFSYAGRRTQREGRFETERGDLVVFVAPRPAGARVQFFLFTHIRRRFSTHHDSQLLPSNR